MNTAKVGNGAEVDVGRRLEREGWVVGSRRHIGGAGDLLAHHPHRRARLIEVKASSRKRGRYADFPPEDRAALSDLAKRMDADALLAWLPPGGELEYVEEARWPGMNGRQPRD